MIEIRKANKNDDFEKMAQYLYYTDPYIFPYMFSQIDECKQVMGHLISQDSGAFSYNNFFVAISDDKVVGVLLYLSGATNFDYDYSYLATQNLRYQYTIDNYISTLNEHDTPNEVYIAMLFVDPEYRRQHIATQLMNHVFETFSNKSFTLHVLKDNERAIAAYQKLGFKIQEEIKGFNGKFLRKPQVLLMKKL